MDATLLCIGPPALRVNTYVKFYHRLAPPLPGHGESFLALAAKRGIAERAWEDLDAVRLTRDFLDAPERYLRAALDPFED